MNCVEVLLEAKGGSDKTARWSGTDALRELRSAGVQARLRPKPLKSRKL